MGESLCMGLVSVFVLTPASLVRDAAHDGLPARMDVDVLDPHRLLAAAPPLGQGLDLRHVGAQQLGGERAVGLELRDVFGPVGAPHQLHGEGVGDGHLPGEHGLDFVARAGSIRLQLSAFYLWRGFILDLGRGMSRIAA